MPTMRRPSSITVRSYDVGFGDCFLLTYHYPKRGTLEPFDRHVLIDFGSFPTKSVTATIDGKRGKVSILERVAREIRTDCGGKLHAVVATHRHADHVNGFATGKKGKEISGDIIRSCKPDLVIQPWTEDPEAQPDARSGSTLQRPGPKAFTAALGAMQRIAAFAAEEADRQRGVLAAVSGFGRDKVHELSFLGGNNIGNRSAVENLMGMGTGSGRRAKYVHYGSDSGLSSVLPGVRTYVLGPPTLKQTNAIRKQRSADPDEFWQLLGLSADRLSAFANGSKGARTAALPFASSMVDRGGAQAHTRWLVRRLRALRGDQLMRIVRALDDQMNNTSVILLFQTTNQRLLFPGDAQIENWEYALSGAPNSARVRKLLEGVTFYKVGHHGSRNATPKTLWELFRNKRVGTPGDKGSLTSMLSTEGGHHGSSKAHTEVPRGTLVDALKEHSHFFTTDAILAKDVATKHVITMHA